MRAGCIDKAPGASNTASMKFALVDNRPITNSVLLPVDRCVQRRCSGVLDDLAPVGCRYRFSIQQT